MDNVDERNSTWSKLSFYMHFMEKIYSLLPKSFCQRNIRKLRFKANKLSIIKRYVLLKRLGTRFRGEGYRIIQSNVVITAPECLTLGRNVTINDNSYFECSGGIDIGDNVMIAHGVSILSNSHNFEDESTPFNRQGERHEKITIGNNVWIGAKVTILMGITIGNNVIISANSLVDRDVSDNQIVGGVPARIIQKVY